MALVAWNIGTPLKMGSDRDRLLSIGLLARGLVLEASRTSSDRTMNGQRFEQRQLVLDVEAPGGAPYEVTITPLIPRICEALPGAVFDLRVDPQNPENIAVVGPAGSSAWLAAAPWLATNTMGPYGGYAGYGMPGVVNRPRMGLFVALLVFGPIFLFGAIGFFSARSTKKPTHTSTSQSHASTPQCDLAARCCTVIGSNCGPFTAVPDSVCAKTLSEERKVAAKRGKHCP